MKVTFEQFIKNYVRVGPEGKSIKFTPTQRAFINWLEENKKKGFNISYLKVKGRI